MAVFPLFFDLSKTDILFVGGGSIAERRVRTLLPFAEKIRVIAAEATDGLRELAGNAAISLALREAAEEDMQADMVFLCTDDQELHRRLRAVCQERGIPANDCQHKEACDFYFPGIVQRGNVVVGVSASGEDHKKARRIRERIEEILADPDEEAK